MSLHRISDAIGLIEEGKVQEALAILDSAADGYPLYVIPRILRAKAYEALGDPERAVQAWSEARFLSPDNPHILAGIQRANRMYFELNEDVIDPADETLDIPPAEELTTELTGVANTPPPPPIQLLQPQAVDTPIPDSDSGVPDELDDLIAQLEESKMEPVEDVDTLPDPLEEKEDAELVSETLARIYVKQARRSEAARVYRLLAQQHPEKAEVYLERASKLEVTTGGTGDGKSEKSS